MMLLFGICIISIKCVKAEYDDDDDDDILQEIITNLVLGSVVGMCQENVTCNYYLSIITTIVVVIMIINWCLAGCKCYKCTSKDCCRAITLGIGNSIGRTIAS